MSTCTDVGSVFESKLSVVQTSNVGFTSEVSDYLVVHTGLGEVWIGQSQGVYHCSHLRQCAVVLDGVDDNDDNAERCW